jgi:hypothetical protein
MTDRQIINTLGDLERLARKLRERLGFVEDLAGPHKDPIGAMGLRCEVQMDLAEFANAASRLRLEGIPTHPVRVVPAEAVVDTGEHEPEDDGQPSVEEIDEAAIWEASFDHLTRAFRRVKGGAA